MNAAATSPEGGVPEVATPDQPGGGAERLVTLDFVRGIAVLGILFANITAFGHPYTGYYWPHALAEPATAGDKLVWLFQVIFVDNKFRGLFSVLFGAGLYLFIERAWARGQGEELQLRRLAILLVVGLAHYFLIWRGDILTVYAVSGILALPMVIWTARKQLLVGITLYAFGLLAMIAMLGASLVPASGADGAANPGEAARAQVTLERAQDEVVLYQQGSYAEIVEKTVTQDAGQLLLEVLLVVPTETLALVLIGMALIRLGFFSGGIDPAKMRRWGWIGVVVGLLVTVPAALIPYRADFPLLLTMFVFNGLARVGQLPMVVGLAALLTLWAPKATQGWLGKCFSAAGRMAFSNYLGTSILMMFVFHGWALGFFGEFHRVELLVLVAATWVLMLAWSKWWLGRFRYGPLEWLWRCLTYGRLFPLRR